LGGFLGGLLSSVVVEFVKWWLGRQSTREEQERGLRIARQLALWSTDREALDALRVIVVQMGLIERRSPDAGLDLARYGELADRLIESLGDFATPALVEIGRKYFEATQLVVKAEGLGDYWYNQALSVAAARRADFEGQLNELNRDYRRVE
jgi:hypothetical protein